LAQAQQSARAGKGYDSIYFVMELRNNAVIPDVA